MIVKSHNLVFQVQRCCQITTAILLRQHHVGTHHAVLIGCYKEKANGFKLTESGKALQHIVGSNIIELLSLANFKADAGKSRSFFNLHKDYPCVTVAGLGDEDVEINRIEEIDQKSENVRIGIGSAIKSLKKYEFNNVSVDSCGLASASAEGAFLSNYVFEEYKSKKKGNMEIDLLRFQEESCDEKGWQQGFIAAESQNFARGLMEMPSNYKFPYKFADIISKRFSMHANVEMFVRDEPWAEEKQMGCFLSVGKRIC